MSKKRWSNQLCVACNQANSTHAVGKVGTQWKPKKVPPEQAYFCEAHATQRANIFNTEAQEWAERRRATAVAN